MTITTYSMMQDEAQHPVLIRESEHLYAAETLPGPTAVTAMLNEVFRAELQSEEHMYMVSLNAKNEVLGAFEISHGTQDATYLDPRSVLTRAILSGAEGYILAHNHPSGSLSASKEDTAICSRMREASTLMGVRLWDFILVGKHGEFLSFSREGLSCLTGK